MCIRDRAGTVNRTLLDHAAAYVAWLVGEKGYDCIRYYLSLIHISCRSSATV